MRGFSDSACRFNPWKVGDSVRFAHQKQGEAKFTVKATLARHTGPMIELEELPGEFAVHLFVAADYPDDSIVPRPR
jgi:hypothetical protein